MDEVFPVCCLFALVVCLVAALYAWLQQRYAMAHAINLVPGMLVGAFSLMAVVAHSAGHVRAGGVLVVIDGGAACRSLRWAPLFWLTWLLNACLLGGLFYLLFFLQIF